MKGVTSRWNGANFSQKVAGSVNVLLKDCTISGSCSESPEMYDVRFARATKGMFEDYRFDLTGIPARVFLRRDRMW